MGLRIAVAMSGGVDSTAAALILKAQGHQLVGVFMRNWDELNEQGQCTSDEDYLCVQHVCDKLEIPCRRVDLIKEYWMDVFSQYLDGLQRGVSINPDILCNQRIKFRALLHSLSAAGTTREVDRIATGHYARISHMQDGSVKLLQGIDDSKDQTYFLSLVSQSALQRTLFSVGHMTKQEVRQLVTDSGFKDIAARKESYGLCFVGKRKFSRFISNYLEERKGDFITPNGKVIGHHKGHHLYTIGQRARLGGYSSPHYVLSKCPESNTVTVVKGNTHPALYTHTFLTTPPHWIHMSHDLYDHSKECSVKTNNRQRKVSAVLRAVGSRGVVKVTTATPLRAITPGQFAVFYDGEECLGGSRILQPNSDHFELEQTLNNTYNNCEEMVAT